MILGEGAKGESPYPFPQTPIPNPLGGWHRRPACEKCRVGRSTIFRF
jgi:hypothetical protein